ncbi:hypothetical protein BD779DRAFT_1145035 [Infundibulicybe gibba]|nr:hypothetical protein BD779DRAFT_1145035 [Infundibulicybe gibba]
MSDTPTSRGPDIDRIPPEVLSDIFVRCLPKDFLLQSTPPEATVVPLLLGGVCRSWHALALATPALWTSLNITCYISTLRPPLPVIRTYLQRSGIRPLSFTIRADELEGSDSPNVHLRAVLTVLTATRQRWRNVHINLYTMAQDILDLITMGDMPLLQNMQWKVMEPSNHTPIPLHMLHRCPHLQLFHLDSFESSLLLPRGDTHLTSLLIRTFLSVSECATLLRLSPHLFSADFHLIESVDPSPVPHLTHPTLCTFAATGEHSDTLLGVLTLPALQDLDLTGEPMALSADWIITLSAFFERSRPTLRHLSLSMTHMQSLEPALLQMLVLTPHLHSLRLSDCGSNSPPFTAALIHALHPPPPPGIPLCPRLQRLYLHGISGCPDGLCSTMLRARWDAQAHENGVTCLKQGYIRLEGGAHDRDKANVKKLYAEGMWMELCLKN